MRHGLGSVRINLTRGCTMLKAYLFGQFHLQVDGCPAPLEPARAQDLLCFLLLNPSRAHARDHLAGVLWGQRPEHGRAYLRKALWQLQAALSRGGAARADLLVADEQSIRLAPGAAWWSDVRAFDAAYEASRGVPGHRLTPEQAGAVEAAVALYAGDLLAHCFQDWCVVERERLHHRYLAMLGKLMDYCEAERRYEQGVAYAMHVLKADATYERAHRQLMRLFYLGGQRTEALRQYRRCADVLRRELAAEPSPQTRHLYDLIRRDQRLDAPPGAALPASDAAYAHLRTQLAGLQQQLRSTAQAISSLLDDTARDDTVRDDTVRDDPGRDDAGFSER